MAGHGRYTIVSKLADGGMAEIFLGIQHGAEGFQKPVVLKRILTAFSADPQFRNMFLDEAHISMSLNHSNVVQVLDLGVSRGRYFLVLELVDGWDLDKILQRAKAASMVWPPALSLYVVGEVCRALAFAHGKLHEGKPLGIVHRDISPNNVLISDQGEVKLADFGIAKAQRKREQTAAGVIKGKIAFMSPEQATGGPIDRRSDLFSVGSMLYLMATDKLPFESATDLEAIFRVQRAEFTPPEVARPGVGPEVSRIIMRAMRLVPAERYQTADEMLVDVERVLRTEYQSAGQTELKLWMAQLARRDGAQAIGKTQAATLATVTEGGTDINVGSSFELVDFDDSVVLTEGSFAPGAVLAGGKGPPPLPTPTPPAGAPLSLEPAPPPPRETGTMRAVENKSRGLRGFWFGATFALAAVIGARYVIEWARTQPFLGGAPTAAEPPPSGGMSRPAANAPPPSSSPPSSSVPAPSILAPAKAAAALPSGPAEPAATAAAADAGGAHPAEAVAAGARKPDSGAPLATGDSPDEPDEEALLRQALPNAETAVIGEEEADEPSPGTVAKSPGGAKSVKAGKAARAASDKNDKSDKKDDRATGSATGAASAKSETVSLHITSSPVGAVVRTRYKVLGRTPISLHFRGGNTYELMFIKRGYAQATKRVTLAGSGAKDRRVAVVLKKSRTPAGRPNLFRIHR
jgi:eukaryotic-like serine/threonine-protein kinase